MKKIIIAALSVLLLVSCSKDFYPVESTSTIVIDGAIAEWDQSALRVDEGSKLVYGVRRDAENLYLLVKAGDQATITKIMGLGLTIWIDGKGKSSKRQGVRYPVGVVQKLIAERAVNRRNSGRVMVSGDRGTRMGELKNTMEESLGYIELIGIGHDNEDPFRFNKSELSIPIQAEVNSSVSSLTYELAVPLYLIDPYNEKKGIIGLGFETQKLEMTRMLGQRGMGMRSMAGRFRGRPGPMRSGTGRPGQGGMRERLQALGEPFEFWVKLDVKSE